MTGSGWWSCGRWRSSSRWRTRAVSRQRQGGCTWSGPPSPARSAPSNGNRVRPCSTAPRTASPHPDRRGVRPRRTRGTPGRRTGTGGRRRRTGAAERAGDGRHDAKGMGRAPPRPGRAARGASGRGRTAAVVADIRQALREGTVDLAVVALDRRQQRGPATRLLSREDMVLLASFRRVLAERRRTARPGSPTSPSCTWWTSHPAGPSATRSTEPSGPQASTAARRSR